MMKAWAGFWNARRSLVWVALAWSVLGALGGCASSGRTAATHDDIITESDEPAARRRARIRMELAIGYFEQGQTKVRQAELVFAQPARYAVVQVAFEHDQKNDGQNFQKTQIERKHEQADERKHQDEDHPGAHRFAHALPGPDGVQPAPIHGQAVPEPGQQVPDQPGGQRRAEADQE